ncbi:VanW family protein [Ureibacillus manganicus]|uniref:Vancomycin resistance protein n=1 Tax=Ureibacillus manganicus DSM 26584 TaxID=1384049 RepID=A0A0A3ISA2_9BACL|nr:VanW family protein [Ureibacillus manganicus]KGR77712.1 vancomycin resistance protein [Ureibacillus manganicus DSM 26584]
MRLSEIHPIFYHLRIGQKRLFRGFVNLRDRKKFATKKQLSTTFHHTCKKHQSLLRRTLGNSDPQLQENKIVNLKIASSKIDGIIIGPGETFSFWKLVGKTTKNKGYIEGMQLARGEVKTGIGGGICQLANLLYWMALHTPLVVTERHHHSFDPFPDSGRTLPFGSGASVFYNYVDIRLFNPTSNSFQIKLWLTEKHLKGAIFSNEGMPYAYHIEERNHQFLKHNGKNYRQNEIWRKTIEKKTGNLVNEELLIKNFSEVKYPIPENILVT